MPSRRTLIVSRSRAKPASRNMKPACMKNTRNAVTSTHMVLMGLQYSGSGGVAGAAVAAATAFVDTADVAAATALVAASVTLVVVCACAWEAERYIEITM